MSCVYCGAVGTETFVSANSMPKNYNGDYFLFFTDSHSVSTQKNAEISDESKARLNYLGELRRHSAVQFSLCGGDWLNNSNRKENAIQSLKEIKSLIQNAFGEKSYLVVGNHDYNYQLWINSHMVTSPWQLTSKELSEALFPEYGKTYYSFLTDSSRFYVFDSGIDWSHDDYLTELDIEQVSWYLRELSENNDEHIVLSPHMVYTDDVKYHPATRLYAEISSAYNKRQSYSYNGKIYDFSQKTGFVEYIIAGHSHYDEIGEIEGIPYILTHSMQSGESPTADFVFSDYTARKIYLTRIGEGSSREIALPSFH